MDFLNAISLEDEQELSACDVRYIESMGVESPRELLGLINAAHADVARVLGNVKTRALQKSLEELVGAPKSIEYRRRPPRFATGAVITRRKPQLKARTYDVNERNRLFDELQNLKSRPSTNTSDARISQLEKQLNELLETSPK